MVITINITGLKEWSFVRYPVGLCVGVCRSASWMWLQEDGEFSVQIY